MAEVKAAAGTMGTEPWISAYAEVEKARRADGSSRLEPIRREAIGRFEELGFPGRRDEEWKYTNLGPLRKIPFRPAAGSGTVPDRGALDAYGFGVPRLVFVDGRFDEVLSSPADLPEGVYAGSLSRALEGGPVPDAAGAALESHLTRHEAVFAKHPFAALNTAFFTDGAFFYVPRGVAVETPLHILFVTTARPDPAVVTPRVLAVLEESAELTVIEDYVTLGREPSLTNILAEVSLEPNSSLDHYRLLREGDEAFHVSTLAVSQSRVSRFRSQAINFGGRLVRNDIEALLDGEDCECTLNGLLVATGSQHIDNHTRIVHARPGARSWEMYKSILDDRASGVFNGKIFVRPEAQKTDAKQTNNSLLLSEDALMNSKPELEIYADDVKCTHGATVGQLDEDALFYMRTRGIGAEAARNILTFAFASEVVEEIRVERLREAVENLLYAKLPGQARAEETEAAS